MDKRTKEIKIRLTQNEYQSLIDKKTKPRLAHWLRELALNQQQKKKVKQADPRLLYELNRIGVNLNQIAKQCNQQKGNINLVSISLSLRTIEQKLQKVMEDMQP